MIKGVSYEYADGPLLDKPHTYMYTDFFGHPFLEAWGQRLALAKSELGEPLPPSTPSFSKKRVDGDFFLMEDFLESTLHAISRSKPLSRDEIKKNLFTPVKKFEFSKKLFGTYSGNFIPRDKTDFRNLGVYLRMAEVVGKAYALTEELPYLNVFLKLIDLLIAYKGSLDESQKRRLAWQIDRLIEHVVACAQKSGVSLCI